MKEIECKFCKNKMELDDIDYNFKGNQDNYWFCYCGASCFERIRYGKSISKEFKKGEKKNDKL